MLNTLCIERNFNMPVESPKAWKCLSKTSRRYIHHRLYGVTEHPTVHLSLDEQHARPDELWCRSNKWPIVVTSKEELATVDAAIYHEGPHCDLNHLDISAVTDLSKLFQNNGFEGDISKVMYLTSRRWTAFSWGCAFNGDISQWNTSNVQDMSYMFMSSNFNNDISGMVCVNPSWIWMGCLVGHHSIMTFLNGILCNYKACEGCLHIAISMAIFLAGTLPI